MRIRTSLTAAALGIAIAFGGLAVTAPAALAKTVEGKVMSVGTDTQTITINRKIYRLSEGAKILVSGKPTSYASLKPGMTCKASIANSSEATLLNCTAKR
jgi:hypothetical protein